MVAIPPTQRRSSCRGQSARRYWSTTMLALMLASTGVSGFTVPPPHRIRLKARNWTSRSHCIGSMPLRWNKKCTKSSFLTMYMNTDDSGDNDDNPSLKVPIFDDVDGIGTGTITETPIDETIDEPNLIIDDIPVVTQEQQPEPVVLTEIATTIDQSNEIVDGIFGDELIVPLPSEIKTIGDDILEESIKEAVSNALQQQSINDNLMNDKQHETAPLPIVEAQDIIDNHPLLTTTTETNTPDNISLETTTTVTTGADMSSSFETSNMTDDAPTPPGVKDIIKFAIPAIGVWLCSPFLSMIDTSAVGLLSGTAQQAALNPAVAVTEYGALLIAFMYTGTTNLIASATESDRHDPSRPLTTSTLLTSLQLSLYVGLTLGTLLFTLAPTLLRLIIGNSSLAPEVFYAAMRYVRIRALGMPAAVIIGSAQAACLGIKDVRSPLYVLAAAALVNFLGDVCLVGVKHPWIGGAAGAAWATVFSQYAALAMFMKWLVTPRKTKETVAVGEEEMTMDNNGDNSGPKRVSITDRVLQLTAPPTSKRDGVRKALQNLQQSIRASSPAKKEATTAEKKKPSVSVRGFLENKFKPTDLLKFPSSPKPFYAYFFPVTTTQVGRVSSYVAMSHVVSSSIGTVAMAAQQIVISLFYCLTPIADSLSLTAQSFVPAIADRKKTKETVAALRKTALNFVKTGGLFGLVLMAFVGCIPLLSNLFTADPIVLGLINKVIPYMLGIMGVHGVVCAAEGVLLGQKDLSFLGRTYAGYFFAVPYFMLRLKRAALSGSKSIGLASVWEVFLGYQLVRVSAWLGRLVMLSRRANKEAAANEETREHIQVLDDVGILKSQETGSFTEVGGLMGEKKAKNDQDEALVVA